jgi:hypothetical protein
MNTMFENMDLWYDDTLGDDKPFVFACKDRENISEERWVLVSLSNVEARKVFDYLQKYFK